MKHRAAVLALWCTLACGCAAMLPRLQAPQLTVTGIAFAGGSMQQQQLRLTLHVTNPNDREITIRGIECTFELEGQPFAQGATDAQFTLPASGETDFALNVTADLSNALAALVGGFGHRTVDYRLYGQVHLRGQLVRNVPFDQKGRLRL
ncbi:MAG TPA: LEA type 2 family protein [Steroidobacteraceae bacterium]